MIEAILLRTRDDDAHHSQAYYTRLHAAILLATIIFTAIAILLTRRLIPLQVNGTNLGGVMSVLIATIALSYPLTTFIRQWDKEELAQKWDADDILRRHGYEVTTYLATFFGATLVFAISTLLLPESFFKAQTAILKDIGAATGNITSAGMFVTIVSNNLSLLFVTFTLSFFATGGMVFIVLWNASVLGVLIGQLSSSFIEIPMMWEPYLVHGTIEIAAYIFAGLAGSLLAYSLEHFIFEDTHEAGTFTKTLGDSFAMLLIGAALILLGGAIEAGLL